MFASEWSVSSVFFEKHLVYIPGCLKLSFLYFLCEVKGQVKKRTFSLARLI